MFRLRPSRSILVACLNHVQGLNASGTEVQKHEGAEVSRVLRSREQMYMRALSRWTYGEAKSSINSDLPSVVCIDDLPNMPCWNYSEVSSLHFNKFSWREQLHMRPLSRWTEDEPKTSINNEQLPNQHDLAEVAEKDGTKHRPTRFDWREHGAVTAVRNQRGCGCCYIIAPAGSTEGLMKIATGKLVELSIQQVIDCDLGGHNDGCHGGRPAEVFRFIAKYGLTTEKLYPFTSWNHNKRKKKVDWYKRYKRCKMWGLEKVVKITDFELVDPNPDALEGAILINPVVVFLWVNDVFRKYNGGILTLKEFPPPTIWEREHSEFMREQHRERHTVLLVAYDHDESGRRFWVGKNSWGEKWGEGGYFRLERDVDHPGGVGGVTTLCGLYPTGYFRPIPSRVPPTFWESCVEKFKKITSFTLNLKRQILKTDVQYSEECQVTDVC